MQRSVKLFTALKFSNSSRSFTWLSTQQAVRQQQQTQQCKHLLHSTTTTTAAVNVNFNSSPSKLQQTNINLTLTANITTNNILSNRREVFLCLTDNFTSQLTFSSAHRQYSTVCLVKSNNKFSLIVGFCKNSLKFASNSIFASNNQNFVWKRFASSENCEDTKMAPKLAPTVKLNNGYEMPVLGLGTYESLNNEAEIAVKHAIDIGYRHIDTAYFYKNEEEIGRALKAKIDDGTVKREELFIVTKLWNIYHDPERVEAACRKQLGLLGLEYVDLYLMHLPVGYKYVDEETLLPKNEEGVLQLSDVDYVDTYKAMEKLVELGLARSIGISNFNSEQTKRILDCCTIKPVTNQVECSPALNQKKLTAFCKQHDITVTAYSPLGRPKPEAKTPEFIFSAQTKAIADKYQKTPAQVVLRYLLDIGVIPIPKSSNPKRIEENFNVFDFQLTAEEQAVMDCFHTGERLVPFNLIKAQKHKYWPFAIEY